MVRNESWNAAEVMLLHPRRADRSLVVNQSFRCRSAQCNDNLWLNHLDLFGNIRSEGCHFVAGRLAILGRLVRNFRAKFDNVGNVDLLALQPHRLDDLGQQLPRRADKGLALLLLFCAGSLAYKHEIRIGIPHCKNHRIPETLHC